MMIYLISGPLQKYYAQHVQLNALRAQVHANQISLDAAKKELQLWNDPTYVESQARKRLHFVLPGERMYQVVDNVTLEKQKKGNSFSNKIRVGAPWYMKLVSSITEVGK